MNASQLIEWIESPQLLVDADLESWEKSFSFIPLVQTLKAKQLQLQSDLTFDRQLKKAAIFAPDRESLYHFIHQAEQEAVIQETESASEGKAETELESPLRVVESEELTEAGSESASIQVEPIIEETKTEEVEDARLQQDREQLEKQLLTYAVSATIEREVSSELAIPVPESQEEEESTPEEPQDPGLMSWLRRVEKRPIDKVVSSDSLITSFIEKGPVQIRPIEEEKPTMVPIDRPKSEFFSLDKMAKDSLREDDGLVTETLAKIYAQQGNLDKAIEVYQKLSLKFPEKSGYFARLISEMKK